jgi:hypothetical protein
MEAEIGDVDSRWSWHVGQDREHDSCSVVLPIKSRVVPLKIAHSAIEGTAPCGKKRTAHVTPGDAKRVRSANFRLSIMVLR